jgi:3-dehydroquinate synthase
MEKAFILPPARKFRSEIIVGEKWTNLYKYLPDRDVVIITDENVYRLYHKGFPDFPVITIKPGEASKSIAAIEPIIKGLLKLKKDRSCFLIGIGGGVVCDITGFIASIYMRGIGFGFVSTTMLSQVDASVGGKNALNIDFYKNVIGTFTQPDFVICDPEMLMTLSDEEYLSGLAELIKMGFILDNTLVAKIERNREKIIRRDTRVIEPLIARSIKLKASVVSDDEKESGKRMILNFGHTFGHIIETFEKQKHGFAIAYGMKIAAGISVVNGLLSEKEEAKLNRILESFNIIHEIKLTASKFEEMLISDKKKKGDKISFILLESIGRAVIKEFTFKELVKLYKSVQDRL